MDPTSRDPDRGEACPQGGDTRELPAGGQGNSGASRAGTGRAGTGQAGTGQPGASPGRARRAGRGVARAGRGTARATGGALRAGGRKVRRATYAQGMGETGLGKIIELHAFNQAGDAAMAVGLAGTLFFAVPTGEARDRVALYLLLTMAPFAIIAPLAGPFLDRFRHGRRWALGLTFGIRAFLVWVMAGSIVRGDLWLYPVAFCALILTKVYGLSRASAVPRLLPPKITLVKANSRISLAGTVGAGVGGGIAAALATIGPQWALRWAFLIFAIGTIWSVLLPARVDSTEGEHGSRIRDITQAFRTVPTTVVLALRANAAYRALSGFLLMFMAFLLRVHPLAGYSTTIQVAAVGAAAGAGGILGTGLGALLRTRRPELVVQVLLGLAIVATGLAAGFYGLLAVAGVAIAAGLCQQLGKLSQDALIQREVAEEVRTSIFARAETLLQLSWVLGGGLGIVLPLIPELGFGICAGGMAVALVLVLRTARRRPTLDPG